VGFAEPRRALALPERLAPGDRIAFLLRDADAAREDLKAMLGGVAGVRPAAGLYFDCCARGASLFGVEGLESGYLGHAFPGVPIAGMLGSCEIGPVGGTTELLTYTGVLAIFDAS
jgi:small ligand-binding sensory domain FIST